MTYTLADQHLAQNAGRRFPLADDTVGMPDNVILDFRCTVFDLQAGETASASLQGVSDDGEWTVVTVRAARGSARCPLTFRFPLRMVEGTAYTAMAEGEFAFGEMTVTAALSDAPWGPADVPFSAATVSGDPLKVMSVQSAEEEDRGALPVTCAVTGDVLLEEGYNTEPYISGNAIKLNIYKGAGAGEYCREISGDQTCGNVMFSINGERPDVNGNVMITGSDGVSVTPRPQENAVEITLNSKAAETATEPCEKTC